MKINSSEKYSRIYVPITAMVLIANITKRVAEETSPKPK